MRTIKFRIWNKKTKNWVPGCGRHKMNSLDGVNLFGETILYGGFMEGISLEDLNECVALQCTGLTDSQGKDIFEGDILRVRHEDWGLPAMLVPQDAKPTVTYRHCKVYWHSRNAMWATEYFDWFQTNAGADNGKPITGGFIFPNESEVIGNIYENPELCK